MDFIKGFAIFSRIYCPHGRGWPIDEIHPLCCIKNIHLLLQFLPRRSSPMCFVYVEFHHQLLVAEATYLSVLFCEHCSGCREPSYVWVRVIILNQSDGQTEVVNRTLEQCLCCFAGGQPQKWLQWIPRAEFSYNKYIHPSTKTTPFEVVYGIPPPGLLDYAPGTSRVQAVDKYLRDRDAILWELHHNLILAQYTSPESHEMSSRVSRPPPTWDLLCVSKTTILQENFCSFQSSRPPPTLNLLCYRVCR